MHRFFEEYAGVHSYDALRALLGFNESLRANDHWNFAHFAGLTYAWQWDVFGFDIGNARVLAQIDEDLRQLAAARSGRTPDQPQRCTAAWVYDGESLPSPCQPPFRGINTQKVYDELPTDCILRELEEQERRSQGIAQELAQTLRAAGPDQRWQRLIEGEIFVRHHVSILVSGFVIIMSTASAQAQSKFPATSPSTKPSIEQKVWQAVEKNDEAQLLRLFQSDLDPNLVLDELGTTPLMLTALRDQPDVFVVLVHFKADVSRSNKYGVTPLHAAATAGHLRMAIWLCEVGANVEVQAPGIGMLTPLQVATVQNHFEVATMLVDRGAGLNAQDEDGMTALHLAVKFDRARIARKLVEAGADPSLKNMDGETALEMASKARKADIIAAIEAGMKRRSTIRPGRGLGG